MQPQIHSYQFQLSEGYQGKSITCHPKEPQFKIGISTRQKSLIYSLSYDQQNPRKSQLNSKNIIGQLNNLYSLDQQYYISTIYKDNQYYIIRNNWNNQQSNQINKQQQPIINILKTKTYNLILCNNKNITLLTNQSNQQLIKSQDNITFCTIDPIHQYLAYVTQSKKINITDKSCKKDKYTIQTISNQSILNIDFNPNKQYYLLCTHYDSIKFYDIRKGNLPVKCLDQHHSFLLNAKYNHSHDQLIIAAYDDGTVGLLRAASVSSVPVGKDQDTMVKLYDQHQDSVYQICWSYFSPWIFGSLGYSAVNFLVNVVPSAQKYRILL